MQDQWSFDYGTQNHEYIPPPPRALIPCVALVALNPRMTPPNPWTLICKLLHDRYDDMDWVRGRPPDALLLLKALVKATSRDLSPSSLPAFPEQPERLPVPHDHLPVVRDPSAAASSRPPSAQSLSCPVDPTTSAEGTELKRSDVSKPAVHCVEARRLAEGALLAPLREVGTLAGSLRGRVGDGLRERAAVRFVTLYLVLIW